MEEKILIQSNNDYAKNLKKKASIVLVASAIVFLILLIFLNSNRYTIIAVLDLAVFVISLILFVFSVGISKTSLTVSDKRVYGSTTFGKRVDLPLDSISAVGIGAFNGIAIGTSSGKISFKGIGNRDDIHKTMSKLLLDRQSKEKPTATTMIKQEIPQSNADELKKYKDLLDSGIITQEEFNAKKKQLLGV